MNLYSYNHRKFALQSFIMHSQSLKTSYSVLMLKQYHIVA